MKLYCVTIDHTHTLELFAKDRKDAINFTKRTHQAKFFAKTYKKITSARVHDVERNTPAAETPIQAP
jgi:hypothetical protein